MTTASGSAKARKRAARFGVSPTTDCSCADPSPIQIADDHQPGGDPDTRLKLYRADIKPTDGVDRAQPRSNGALGIVLMRPRVTEINEHAIAHVLGDRAVEPGDDLGDRTVIGGDDLAQILGIEPRRECRRADQVAEHQRQLPALGRGRGHRRVEYRNNIPAQSRHCREQLPTVPDETDAELLQVVSRQLR
jgi:hypothetical protein